MVSGEPAAGGSCRVCGGTLSESLRCGQCGAAYGEANRCPHCRSVADLEPADALRFRCRVCGGPRVPVESKDVVRSGREIPVLGQARKAHFARAAWAVAAGVVGGFGILALATTLLVIALGPGFIASLALLGANLIPFVAATLAWRKAKSHGKNRDQLLDDAWSLVAADVLAHTGKELEATQLAKLMRIDVARAELVLAHLSAHDFVHARVTDDGEIAYSVSSAKLRVEPTPEDVPAEADVSAEEAQVQEPAQARVVDRKD